MRQGAFIFVHAVYLGRLNTVFSVPNLHGRQAFYNREFKLISQLLHPLMHIVVSCYTKQKNPWKENTKSWSATPSQTIDFCQSVSHFLSHGF
jgi:hypothetical protein